MRCDQFIGLNKRAIDFLNENTKKDLFEVYKNGEFIINRKD